MIPWQRFDIIIMVFDVVFSLLVS